MSSAGDTLLAARARLGLQEVYFGRLQNLEAHDIEVREDLRYACLCCGNCCSGRFRVTLKPRDEARLRALDLEAIPGLSFDDALTQARCARILRYTDWNPFVTEGAPVHLWTPATTTS